MDRIGIFFDGLNRIYQVGWLVIRSASFRDGSGSGSVRVSVCFSFSGFEFGVGFSPTVFRLGFEFSFEFWFPPLDIQ